MRPRPLHPTLFVAGCLALLLTGCPGTYGSGARGHLELKPDALFQYLAKAELARPTVVQAVNDHLRRGARYRQRVLDQKNRWTLATVWVDEGRENVLHVVTYRDETCPACNGTGKRTWNNEMMSNMPFDTRCLKCKGKGFLANHTVERKYILSAGDFGHGQVGTAVEEAQGLSHAPPQTQRTIDRLASKDPRERLQALQWLDQNYVREGRSFQEFLPMLKKAEWFENPPDKRVMLWQFKAGKEIPGEERRAYYRVYANSRSGEVYRKGFYPEQ